MAERSEKTGGRTTIWLASFVLEELDKIAATKGASRSTVVREMVLRGLEREARIRALDEQGAA